MSGPVFSPATLFIIDHAMGFVNGKNRFSVFSKSFPDNLRLIGHTICKRQCVRRKSPKTEEESALPALFCIRKEGNKMDKNYTQSHHQGQNALGQVDLNEQSGQSGAKKHQTDPEDRKSTRLNSSHTMQSRMPSSA